MEVGREAMEVHRRAARPAPGRRGALEPAARREPAEAVEHRARKTPEMAAVDLRAPFATREGEGQAAERRDATSRAMSPRSPTCAAKRRHVMPPPRSW